MQLDPNENLDFVSLVSADDYARYFRVLKRAFELMLKCYEASGGADSFEARTVSDYLHKLLKTIDLLRLKYTYRPDAGRALWIDLSESGFPNAAEVSGLETDLRSKNERLRELPAKMLQKRAILDFMFSRQAEPVQLLAQLSERMFLEALDPAQAFLAFSPGQIDVLGTGEATRSYIFPWGCYDFAGNRPYVHVMTFEQDKRLPGLTIDAGARDRFLELMRAEGSRAPDVGVLAMAIDQAELIYPKILKRVCVGPLYTPGILRDRPPNTADPRELKLRTLFEHYRVADDDFVLFFTEEAVFSKRQEVSRSLLSPRSRVRQIFSISEDDADAYARRASVVHYNVLASHEFLRALTPEDIVEIPDFTKCKRFVFDLEGAVHGL